MNCIFEYLSEEKSQDKFLSILYDDKNSFVKNMKKMMKEGLGDKYTAEIQRYIESLSYDDNLRDFVNDYFNYIIRDDKRLYYNLDMYLIKVITVNVFWEEMAVAMKKCISHKYSKDTVTIEKIQENYSNSIPSPIIQSLNDCIIGFNKDVSLIILSKEKVLQLFLHKFHSQNKRKRTQKKNLNRVKRRTKKLMIGSFDHKNGRRRFNKGVYKTPDIVADYIIRTYLI